MKKLSVIIPIFLTIVLAFSIIGNVSAQPSVGDYIVTESSSNELSSVTPGGVVTLITASGLSEPYGVAIVPLTNPVGGIYAPTNKLNILVTYAALIGLVGVFSTILVIGKWRKS